VSPTTFILCPARLRAKKHHGQQCVRNIVSSFARAFAGSLVAACVRICDKSLRQNLNQPMREHQLVSRHLKFELVYISCLPKSIACDLSQLLYRRGDLSPLCVAAMCRIVPVSRPFAFRGFNMKSFLAIGHQICKLCVEMNAQ